ncbi:hypothetical protein DTL42_02405 [Bremerella cremea]|uniref:Uncharacterized protein n=1 Tax=Bremerella cremea TaxID=1031537 RepID=A0A368KUN9_9BACT|nr:hypothetical protein DTL42_02405 [Bremerella cremea]
MQAQQGTDFREWRKRSRCADNRSVPAESGMCDNLLGRSCEVLPETAMEGFIFGYPASLLGEPDH